MYKNFSNKEIFEISEKINSIFNDNNRYFPAKINFAIQKNKRLFNNCVEDINKVRIDIAQKYGFLKEEEESYFIPIENRDEANKELQSLMSITQSINIMMLKFSDIENLEFTMNQMEAIMFMIEEEVE